MGLAVHHDDDHFSWVAFLAWRPKLICQCFKASSFSLFHDYCNGSGVLERYARGQHSLC